MADIEAVIEKLDKARDGLNAARNAAEEWRRGKVAEVAHTAAQRTALRNTFIAGLQVGKVGIAAIEAELAK